MRISDWSSDVCSSDLHRRGFDVRVVATQVGPLFLDTVRSAEKKRVMELAHESIEEDFLEAGLELEVASLTAGMLEAALQDGWIPILLISSYRFNAEDRKSVV